MANKTYECPFCGSPLRDESADALLKVLMPPQGMVGKLMSANTDKSRAKVRQCSNQDCRFIAVFQKKAGEP